MIATLKRILKDERGFLGTTAGLIGAGIGAASGAAKSAAAQGAKDKNLQLAAETARYSPWTKMDAGAATQQAMSQPGANFFGDMVQGGFGGGMTGKNISQSDAWNDLLMTHMKKKPDLGDLNQYSPRQLPATAGFGMPS